MKKKCNTNEKEQRYDAAFICVAILAAYALFILLISILDSITI